MPREMTPVVYLSLQEEIKNIEHRKYMMKIYEKIFFPIIFKLNILGKIITLLWYL